VTLRKLFNSNIVDHRFPRDIDETMDTNYEVIPVKDNVFKSPTTILAVAAERGIVVIAQKGKKTCDG